MRIPTLLLAVVFPIVARADFILSTRQAEITAGAPLELQLTITNDSDSPLMVNVPDPLRVRLETDAIISTILTHPDATGPVQIAPREFLKINLTGTIPVEASGLARLATAGFDSNSIALDIAERAASGSQAPVVAHTPALSGITRDSRVVDKPPPLAISVYEPVYILIGGDGGLNAKFQISLRYRLFDGRGRLASRAPWIDDLYLSFSQTSLWDLDEASSPFRDSSYRPRLFYAGDDLARFLDGRLRLGLETGAGHESNGKDGEDSRSFNMLYVRPTVTFGEIEGLRFYFAPLIHNYIADNENPDLKDYRGYVDWEFGIGSKGGLNFWAVLRNGERSDFGSIELNASYPLSKLSGGDLTGWLMLQYFGGYGESLLDYREKLDAQLRLGIAVAL